MFRHQGSIISEFISNKGFCVQQVFQALFALTSIIWQLSAEKCAIWHLLLILFLTYFIVFKLVSVLGFLKYKKKNM